MPLTLKFLRTNYKIIPWIHPSWSIRTNQTCCFLIVQKKRWQSQVCSALDLDGTAGSSHNTRIYCSIIKLQTVVLGKRQWLSFSSLSKPSSSCSDLQHFWLYLAVKAVACYGFQETWATSPPAAAQHPKQPKPFQGGHVGLCAWAIASVLCEDEGGLT